MSGVVQGLCDSILRYSILKIRHRYPYEGLPPLEAVPLMGSMDGGLRKVGNRREADLREADLSSVWEKLQSLFQPLETNRNGANKCSKMNETRCPPSLQIVRKA